jgi:hypothetical protein
MPLELDLNGSQVLLRGLINRSFANENMHAIDELENTQQDPFIIKAIAKIHEKKLEAVKNEEYELAKKLKELESHFTNVLFFLARIRCRFQD